MNQFLIASTIEELHVEITTQCNAACPMCARNNHGFGLADKLQLNSWKLGDELKVFSTDLPNLKRAFFCGTHGDPVAAPYLFEAVQACKNLGVIVEIFTNGSLRSGNWWTKITNILTKDDKIIFGIDGIDTNHLYRQNTNIDTILRNLKICCNSNVTTQWDFLVFAHNEHELENCKSIAKELGVNKFRIRKTPRFSSNKHDVRNNINEITHYISPPTNPEFLHPDFKIIQHIANHRPDKYNVQCIYKSAKKIYVNSKLEVLPCCYISDDNEKGRINDSTQLHLPQILPSLRSSSWADILNTPFYNHKLVQSFTGTNTITRCISTCGVIQREHNQNQIVKL